MILPVATLSAANKKSWCHAACSPWLCPVKARPFGRLQMAAPAPRPGSKAFRRHREQSLWRADRRKNSTSAALPRTGRALAPRLAGSEVNIVRAKEAPDILNINVARPWPATDRSTGHNLQAAASQAPECLFVPCHRLLARPWAVLEQGCSAAPPPVTMRLNNHFRGNRTRAAPSAASNICAPFHSRCAVVGARQRASSTLRTFGLSRTPLALGIIPILNHDSPKKKSGY
jgi:hypothetical protein